MKILKLINSFENIYFFDKVFAYIAQMSLKYDSLCVYRFTYDGRAAEVPLLCVQATVYCGHDAHIY